MDASEISCFLQSLCDVADKETLPRFRVLGEVENKLTQGFDPVTEGDRAAEEAIRAAIMERYPEHGIIGEEFGTHNPDAEYCWIIDPIDGTKSFISGVPVWGTLIALYHQGEPLAGAMSQPFTGERYVCDGNSTVLHHGGNTRGLSTSKVRELSGAITMTTSPNLLSAKEFASYQQVESVCKLGRYGGDCYAYCMLAAGHIELVIESGLNIYDIAALIPIVEKAGGVITNWRGETAREGGQVIAAANEELHAHALEILSK